MTRSVSAAAAAIVAGIVLGLALAPILVPRLGFRAPPGGAVLRAELATSGDPVLAAFYQAHGYRRLWTTPDGVRPEALQFVAVVEGAGADDLKPATYRPDALEADAQGAKGDARRLADAEIAFSRAFAAYVGDLHRPAPAARWTWADPAVRLAPTDERQVLDEAAAEPSPAAAVADGLRMNPVYVALRRALAAKRAAGADDAAVRLLEANLERARALPPDLGDRYLLVDAPAQTVWFYEGGQARGAMPVIVGQVSEPTPQMIGLIRYALFNPYWNVPPDLVREKIAPRMAAGDAAYFTDQRFQALSDLSATARPLDPASVDWQAVEAGAPPPRVRQLPGPDNMMGQVKFMLPNPLGVYLHDTPLKGLFGAAARADSAGCVRLKDAAEMAQWLFGRPVAYDPAGPPDQRLNLATPVPVYIVYLTELPGPGGALTSEPDIYNRDPAMLAAVEAWIASRHSSQAAA